MKATFRSVIVGLAGLAFSISCLAQTSIALTPGAWTLSVPGRVTYSGTNFAQAKDGTFGLTVFVEYKDGRASDAAITSRVLFKPKEGRFQRAGNSLLWVHDGQSEVIAHHKWYYQGWVAEKNVKVRFNMTPTGPAREWPDYRITASMALNRN